MEGFGIGHVVQVARIAEQRTICLNQLHRQYHSYEGYANGFDSSLHFSLRNSDTSES